MRKTKYWHKLDNAAKVFPAVSKNSRSNVFRISFYLNVPINVDVLNEAINLTLKRFEVFNVKLRSGLFWNYFSENKNKFEVRQEEPQMCKFFKFSKNNGFLFRVYYFNNKITLETFHALSDGTGALNFIKSFTYKYLRLMGYHFDHEGLILGELPFSNKENEDSFNANYDPKNKKNLNEKKAYHLTGDAFKDDWTFNLKVKVNKDDLLKLVKEKYNATLTQYLTALVAYSIYDEGVGIKLSKKPIKMFVPVNLRPFFNSQSLRNFSLYIKSDFDLDLEWTFIKMLDVTKRDFKDQLDKEKIRSRLGALVSLEKNTFIKVVPLFIKSLFFKAGYYMWGEAINTSSLSNVGVVKLPLKMQELVTDVDFVNSGRGINTTIVSYKDTININFNSTIKDVSVIRSFINFLKNENLDITIDTNYLEEYDEIL